MIASLYDPAKYDGTNASLTSAISPDGRLETGKKYVIPPRCGVAVKLQAGQRLQIENTHGTQFATSGHTLLLTWASSYLCRIVGHGYSRFSPKLVTGL